MGKWDNFFLVEGMICFASRGSLVDCWSSSTGKTLCLLHATLRLTEHMQAFYCVHSGLYNICKVLNDMWSLTNSLIQLATIAMLLLKPRMEAPTYRLVKPPAALQRMIVKPEVSASLNNPYIHCKQCTCSLILHLIYLYMHFNRLLRLDHLDWQLSWETSNSLR